MTKRSGAMGAVAIAVLLTGCGGANDPAVADRITALERELTVVRNELADARFAAKELPRVAAGIRAAVAAERAGKPITGDGGVDGSLDALDVYVATVHGKAQ